MENPEIIKIDNEKSLFEKILHYVSLILKYKKLVIIGTAISALLVVIFAFLTLKLPPGINPMPNFYESYGIVIFQEDGSGSSMSAMLSAFGVESSTGSTGASQLAMQILNSRPFMDNIIDHFNIIEEYGIVENQKTRSRSVIKSSSEHIFYKDSGTLVLSYTSGDPEFAAEFVNYEIELLKKWFFEQGVSTRSNELALMEAKLEELSVDMKLIEEQIEKFQKEHGVLDIRELATAQSTMLTDLRMALNKAELEIRDYSQFSTIEDPALTTLKGQRNNIIGQIRKIEAGYTSSDGRKMPSLEELPQLSLAYTHMEAELSLKNQLYLTLSERYEVTKLLASDAGAFSVLEYAEVPELKIGPMRGQMCMKVTLGAFAGFVILAMFLDKIKILFTDPKNKKILLGDK
jgi:uncharacterized protein involved in exopolysaccharide biosynthesis